MGIAEFLEARYNEDEKTTTGLRDMVRSLNEINDRRSPATRNGTQIYDAAAWALGRLLGDIAVKRRMADPNMLAGGPETEDAYLEMLRILAQPYAEHPDFDPDWSVDA